ncbi:mechanosensitive ion channel family protein [Pseudodesulfovibrio sediminis]|uniref:Mechanosensitive ion channel protein n=1 Tax=Pseudodesulfovibrio sediminis TaxID=2810563 RepID=A0ABM7PAN7_9BACT|nr:mechanosensitive ion channel domain-containing protein [Pseudodesulfovibrio sediminis]BCS90163.1 mechanosensitive ion channel protein [Pseudodesulfovibrio sediminis]
MDFSSFDSQALLDQLMFYLTTYGIQLLVAILVFIVGKWIARKLSNGLKRIMLKSNAEETLCTFIGNITYFGLLAAVVIAALDQAGVNVTSFMAVLGAAGLAVGLALKDSLSNFACGVMLIMMRFFKKGDFIEAGGVMGTVKAVKIFNTDLNTPDNKLISIPNSAILGGAITNFSAEPTRRVDLVMGIGYDDDLKKAKALLVKIVNEHPLVLKDPAPQVELSELADSSVNFVVRPWCKTGDYWRVFFDVTEQVKLTFDAEGISIPYPQQDVHMYEEKKQ